jgi:hypothetical protein
MTIRSCRIVDQKGNPELPEIGGAEVAPLRRHSRSREPSRFVAVERKQAILRIAVPGPSRS